MMVKSNLSNSANSLVQQLVAQSKNKFTGRLEVKTVGGRQWNLYFGIGRLAWASNCSHAVRQFRRNLSQHCPQINFDRLDIRDSDRFSCWTYQVLWVLAKRKKISNQQFLAIAKALVSEVLFDLLQQSKREKLTYTCYGQNTLQVLRMQPIFVNLKAAFSQAQQDWQSWVKVGLSRWSPNLAPRLKNPEALKQRISPGSYKNLSQRLNGTRTLRELAQQTKQAPDRLLKSLAPYLQKQWVELVEVPDVPRPSQREPIQPVSPPTPSRQQPLVACVDDSPQVCQIMEKILTQGGYRALTISDSVQAIPILLENKPDFLFLDLVMPVANGYEICSQLRRISAFEKVPIAILTGNDKMLDRMRSKMVKASEFLAKPIDPEKVLEVVGKYLNAEAWETPSHDRQP